MGQCTSMPQVIHPPPTVLVARIVVAGTPIRCQRRSTSRQRTYLPCFSNHVWNTSSSYFVSVDSISGNARNNYAKNHGACDFATLAYSESSQGLLRYSDEQLGNCVIDSYIYRQIVCVGRRLGGGRKDE